MALITQNYAMTAAADEILDVYPASNLCGHWPVGYADGGEEEAYGGNAY